MIERKCSPDAIRTSQQPLRPYQQQAVDEIHEKLKENRSTLLVIPTGTGKTGHDYPVDTPK